MSTSRRAITWGVSAVRRYGFRPTLIAAALAHRLRERRRRTQLREHYATIVASPPMAAALRCPSVELPAAAQLPAQLRPAAEALRSEAEAVLQHRVEFLGSGLVELGPQIDWHRDFKSGYRWPAIFYQDVEVTRLDDDSDAKVPWELSRGHQLLTLARAARLYEEERFAAELEAQLESWLDANPPGYGINWVTPMEVAIRAVNWIWAIGTLEGWRPLAPALRARVAGSLQAHARHIASNLEGSPLLRGNHYLADVMGMLVLALALPDDPAAGGWERFARRALEREIHQQVHDDGVGFEASLPYHGLSLEMFLVAWLVAHRSGRPLSERYRQRLEDMLEVSRAVRHPDGRSPVFGDQDSGRILPAGFARPPTQDNLLDLGSACLGLDRWHEAPVHEEVAWTLGVDAWGILAQRPLQPRPVRTSFPQGGLYVLDGEGVHIVVRWGGVGQNGNGGHAHNDLSSYELSLRQPLIVDSGTYLYTADITARDAFRSAAAHNVMVVDGLEMHPFRADEPFRMPACARFQVEEFSEASDEVALTGSHDGFGHGGAPLRVRRRIVLDRTGGTVEVSDQVVGEGEHRLESLIHLAPGWEAETAGSDAVLVRRGEQEVEISFAGHQALTVEPGWVSSEYGRRDPAPRLRAVAGADLPAGITYRIDPRA